MDMSLVYISAVILIVAIGFVFAMRMAIAASLSTDREWPAPGQEAKSEAAAAPVASAR